MLKNLLDTNIAIYVIKRRPMEVLGSFNRHARQLCMSAISYAELIHGVAKSLILERNFRIPEDFCSLLTLLDYGQKAAAHYGDMRADLERKGTPIGVNEGATSLVNKPAVLNVTAEITKKQSADVVFGLSILVYIGFLLFKPMVFS